MPSFTLKASHYLGVRPTQVLALSDESLIVAADRTDPTQRMPRHASKAGKTVDLVRFEIPK